MARTGVAAAWTAALGVALAIGPVSPSPAARAPSDDARTASTPASASASATATRAGAPKPTVTRLTPQTGSTAGGFQVVIKGRNLSGAKKVFFGGTKATGVRVKSGRKLVVVAPPHVSGPVRVRVVTKGGGSKQGKATHFTYVTPAPTLGQLTARSGPTTGGAVVTISGADLAGATAVRFGSSNAASFSVTSPGTIRAVTPPRPVGAVDVTVVTPGGAATLADAYSFVAAPTLSAVTPSSGPAAGATVTVSGTGLTSDAVVTFGGLVATDVQSSAGGTTLTVTTPPHAPGWVDVVVTTPGGSASLTRGYLFVGGVSLTGVSPSVGPTAGFVDVTLTGTGFTSDTLVMFGTKPSLDVSVNPGGTQLTAVLPPQGAGVVDVVVTTEGDSDVLAGAFTYVVAPTLAGVSPTAGPVAGGTTVTLTGSGFRAGMLVGFGGVPATGVVVTSATQATVTAPAHGPGPVAVTVSTPGGTATLPDGYTYVAIPALTSVSPDAGPVTGGTSGTLTGSGFRAGMQVSFGGVPATGVVVTSSTQATVVTPAHAAGTVDVSVSTPGGPVTLPNAYTYVAAPVLTAVSPDAGPTGGGTTVTLTGTGFRTGTQVSFGGTPATGVVVTSATSAIATTPARPAGPVDVTVTTPGGSSGVPAAFTYVVSPILASVTPATGPTAGGTSVTLTGSGFRAGMQVRFGGDPATVDLVNQSGTQATVLAPAHTAGPVPVSVTTAGGSDSLSGAFTYVVAPALTSLAPDAGPVAGGTTVTLTGSGFRADTQVLFGTTPATGVVVNPGGTELTATAPPHPAGAVDVTVSTPGGSASLSGAYTYVALPTLTAVAPDAGPVTGGTPVTLTGSGFRAGMQVLFGAAAATGVSVSPDGTQLTALPPAHVPGTVDVSVTTPGGSASFGNSYTYLAAPAVTGVSPALGPAAGGTTITLTGTGFRPGTEVSVGGTPATDVAVNPAGTSLTATTPPHPAGLVAVSVTTPGGTDSLAGSFTYVAAPTITSVSPVTGPTSGGTAVTITGTDLNGATEVTFGGVPATTVVVVDATTLTAVTLAHPAGPVDVSVTTVGGSGTATDAFTYVAPPTLDAVTPGDGSAAGGTTVTLTGSGLTGTTSVTFDGVPATGLVVVSDAEVTVDTPAHAPGVVDVGLTAPGGTVSLVDGYTYTV